MSARTVVEYRGWDPLAPEATHIAIQSQSSPPYVWCVYRRDPRPSINFPSDMAVMSAEAARALFDFKKVDHPTAEIGEPS